ncbi:MAG: hypothetical protein DRP93_04515, partial [Candidatus Neomarinimicrobiota bacterium]
SSNDWVVRLLSGSGSAINNIKIPRAREISFALKTAQPGLEVAVLIDDDNSQMEGSLRMNVEGDNAWHTYSVRLDSAELWTNYSNGNGAIDGDYVTLDALMFYAPNQSADRIIYLDAVEAIKINNPIEPAVTRLPEVFKLHPNYPNPFNAHTTLNYDIPINSYVNISIYDIHGRRINTLVNSQHSSGSYSLSWNCTNVPSGMYIAIMQVNGKMLSSQKMLLVK